MSIIRAILEGEKGPYELAGLADVRVKKSKDEIAASLQGEWKDDLLFVLRESLDIYSFCHDRIARTDLQIEKLLKGNLTPKHTHGPLPTPRKKKKKHKNDPGFDLSPLAWQSLGADLYEVDGIIQT